jgi:hypothetical protein
LGWVGLDQIRSGLGLVGLDWIRVGLGLGWIGLGFVGLVSIRIGLRLDWIGFCLVRGIKNKFNIFNVYVGSVRKSNSALWTSAVSLILRFGL